MEILFCIKIVIIFSYDTEIFITSAIWKSCSVLIKMLCFVVAVAVLLWIWRKRS